MFYRTESLRPTERTDSDRVRELAIEIKAMGIWTKPILVHDACLAILDGHHRHAVAVELGLLWVPCRPITYDSSVVTLTAWREHEIVSKEDVFRAASTGVLLPYKTTRHILSFELGNFDVSLRLLRGEEHPETTIRS